MSTAKTLLQKSIVKVYCLDYEKENIISQGTGFFITSTGTFITNAHVVKDAYYIRIKTYLGTIYDVTYLIKFNDISSDYAILKANGCISTPVKFAEYCEIGDTVYAYGFPNDSVILKATEGKVIYDDTKIDSQSIIENTAKIDHGSSGGILANTNGEVLGITTGQLDNNNYAAIKYSDFKNELKKALIGTKEPIEWFHIKQKVYLSSYNFEDYFDVIVIGNAITDTFVSYQITIKLKEKYKSEKISLDSTGLSVFFNIKTTFEWYEPGTYIDMYRYDNNFNYLDVEFNDVDDLFNGKIERCTTTLYIYTTKYHSMEISYNVSFTSIIGNLYTIE